jgi:hypothetical protein
MRQSIASSHSSALPVWAAPAASFLVWAAATASLVAWGLAFWPGDGRPLANSVSMDTASNRTGVSNTNMAAAGKGIAANTSSLGSANSSADTSTADLGKVLGASTAVQVEPAAPSLVSRLALLGIAKRGKEFSALIAVDGQAAKPFAKGAEVLPGLVLQNVSLQQASLGASISSPAQIQLDMPKRAEPARGVIDKP